MTVRNSFVRIFDKSLKIGHAGKSVGRWIVTEHESGATMNRLEVNANGNFWGFDHDLVKGIKDTTAKMSSALEDKDCDGIAFFIDDSKQEHLVFAELKSGFDIKKLTDAFHQITMSFIKMHAWLSLCKHYNLKDMKVHFIAACKCYKDKNQENSVMLRISQAQQLGNDSFEAKFLRPLLKKHHVEFKLSAFKDIQKLPFHDSISNKEITMYLQLTRSHGDSQTSVILA